MQRYASLFISVKCRTCFRRFLRPSSGAQKLYILHRVICQNFSANFHCRGTDGTAVPSLPRQWQVAVKFWQSTRCCIYRFWDPDVGLRNRLKHVERFTEINNLCNVASCWLSWKYVCTDPWTSNITEVLLDKVRKAGLEVNLDETKCQFCSHYRDVKQLRIKSVAKFRC